MTAPPEAANCRIVELRQYTLHPGRRDTLVRLFEREFIEPQEAAGIAVLGQFTDLDDPDRFVWWRGFADLPARAAALQTFYDGPVWRAHRDAANATMIDSDNVLLLRPLAARLPPFPGVAQRAPQGATTVPGGVLLVTVCALPPSDQGAFARFFEEELAPALRGIGAGVAGGLVTETGPNNFPRLPVREGENVLVGCALLPDREACARHERDRSTLPAWQRALKQLAEPPRLLRLAPTPRSRIHL
jgi:hypothetical protein